MPRKIDQTILDDALRLINSGTTIKKAAQVLGVSNAKLGRHLRNKGLFHHPRAFTADRKALPTEEIVSLYEAGNTEQSIAIRFNVSRDAIRRRLLVSGIKPRGLRESQLLANTKRTVEQRKLQTKAANIACAGSKRSPEKLRKAARLREETANLSHVGPGEAEFSSFLKDAGIAYIRQKAVDIYNIDFAIGHVAVEMTMRTTKYRGRNAKELDRFKEILKAGYSIVSVEFSDVPTLSRSLEKIVAAINELRSLPPIATQYRMIRCHIKTNTVIHDNLGRFSRIETPEQLIYADKTINI